MSLIFTPDTVTDLTYGFFLFFFLAQPFYIGIYLHADL
jgi:hypothetical protein